MRSAVVILVAVFVGVAQGASKCTIEGGHRLEQFSRTRTLKMKVPCKYNAVLQQCGPYQVTVTPGQQYVFPTYILDSVWIGVENTESGQVWEGRTSNKLAALYIVKGEDRSPLSKRSGNLNTEDLFRISHTRKDVTFEEKKGVFSITMGPFDFNGQKATDSRLEFVCNADNELTPYPTQFCGSAEGQNVKDRTERLFQNKRRIDLTVLYDVFTDTSISQTDPVCQEATTILTEQCKTEQNRTAAIRLCHHILDSDGHTQCVVKYACNPMDIFRDCLLYACSGFKDKAACARIGQATDLCREFPELTDRIQEANCYKDLLTWEDNPYYPRKKSRKN